MTFDHASRLASRRLFTGVSLVACLAASLAPRVASAQTTTPSNGAVSRSALRLSFAIGSSVLWRVSDGYELFDSARAAPSLDALVGVDLLRAGRFELDAHLGYRFDEARRRYGQNLGTALATHTLTVGATARFAVVPWFAVFGRAQAASGLWVARIAPDAGAQLESFSASFGGVASVGVIVRSGPLLGDDARVNMGVFASVEAGAQLFNDAEIDARPAPPTNAAIAREALPITGANVARVNASTPFVRAMAGLRF